MVMAAMRLAYPYVGASYTFHFGNLVARSTHGASEQIDGHHIDISVWVAH